MKRGKSSTDHDKSASAKITTSPCAARTPVRTAQPLPRRSVRFKRSRGNVALAWSTTAEVESREPLSTTITSQSICSRHTNTSICDSVYGSRACSLYAGMTSDSVGLTCRLG